MSLLMTLAGTPPTSEGFMLYKPATRPYSGLPALEYPFHDRTVIVTQCSRLCFGRRKINLSQAFAGQRVGVTQVEDHSGWSASCATT